MKKISIKKIPKREQKISPKRKLTLLKDSCQRVFNRYIVLRDRECCICGSRNSLQASHYFSVKRCPNVRYNEDNVHAMCAKCHTDHHYGSGHKYTRFMDEKYGSKWMDDVLLPLSRVSVKYSAEEIREKRGKYECKVGIEEDNYD